MAKKLFSTMSLVGLALLLCSAPARAQNALGDGTALDANLSADGPRNVPQAGPDFRLRNLLVTRNIAGGRGFRDAVGYRAADDFRGATGSDDLFTFRANSALSSLEAINIGRTSQSIGIGQDIGLVAFRRDATGATLMNLGPSGGFDRQVLYGDLVDAEARLDRSLLDYQSNGRLLEAGAASESLAYFRTEDGQVVQLSASALRGLRYAPIQQDLTQIGLTPFDQARLLDQAMQTGTLLAAPGTPYSVDAYRLLSAERPEVPDEPLPSLDATVPQSYQDILRSMAESTGGATPEENARRFTEHLNQTATWLRGGAAPSGAEQPPVPEALPGQPGGMPPGMTPPATAPGQQPPITLPGVEPTNPSTTLPGADVDGPETRQPVRMPEGMTVDMLRHGRVIDTLVTDEGDRFSEIMRAGEERLREGDYFLAERQFVRASNFHPNHPMALAGIANAQVSAGILASAAVSLRNLFVNHPEMIDVQYGPGLLPPEERLERIIASLEQRLEGERRTSGAAMLLAFIGRQTSDRDLIERGLRQMEASDSADPLVPVLRDVWLGEGDGEEEEAGDEADEAAAGEGESDGQ